MDLPKPLNCSEVGDRKVLEALINRKLAVDEEDRLLKHLRTCPECLSELAMLFAAESVSESPGFFFDAPNY